jgi:hypothetical protein
MVRAGYCLSKKVGKSLVLDFVYATRYTKRVAQTQQNVGYTVAKKNLSLSQLFRR